MAFLTLHLSEPENFAPRKKVLHVQLDEPQSLPDMVPPEQAHPEELTFSEQPEQVISNDYIMSSPSSQLVVQELSEDNTAANSPASSKPPVSNLSPSQIAKILDEGSIGLLEMEFDIFMGQNSISSAKVIQSFESDLAGNYSIKVYVGNEKSGSGNSEQTSEIEITGRVTKYGLRSDSYTRRGAMARNLMALDNNKATDQPHVQSGRMPDGILDRISMLYQFMYNVTEQDEGTFNLSDGDKISTYTYLVVGSELVTIESLGTVKTRRIIFSNIDTPESIELWVASDLKNLPLKVRHTNAEGSITEQVASSVHIK